MPRDLSWESRRLGMEWPALALHASEAQGRASLQFTAQTWLELAERAEQSLQRHAIQHSLQRHAIQMAIGDELKSLYGVSPDVPPYFLAVLARLDGETATWGLG